jgi:DNA ligase (NAD+)
MNFRSIDDLMRADVEQLTAIHEIGPKIAASIISFFADEENISIVGRLKDYGIRFQEEGEQAISSEALKGKSILISGVFQRHTREEYKALIESHGGRNVTSLSSGTTFILAGENMGPSKKAKAEEAGVPLINEDDFLKLINEE